MIGFGKKKILGMVILTFFGIAVVAGCDEDSVGDAPGENGETPDGQRTITDMAGRTVEVPEEIDSVMGLSSTNRFFVYFDVEDKMVGVREAEKGPDHRRPWELAIEDKIAEMPSYDTSDIEGIAQLNPDVILRCHSVVTTDYQEEENIQNKTNIPVVIGKPYVSLYKNTPEFYETVELVGDLLNKEERAEELIAGVEEIIKDLDERTRDIPEEDKPSAYVGGKSWAGSHDITSTSSYYSALEFINAENVAAEVGEENAFVDREAIIDWDPDIIFVEKSSGYEMCLEDLNSPEFEQLSAVQNEEIYRIFLKISNNTNFANVLVNAYYMGSVIYPDEFADVDFKEKADEIYELFFGHSIYDKAKSAEFEGGHERLDSDYLKQY